MRMKRLNFIKKPKCYKINWRQKVTRRIYRAIIMWPLSLFLFMSVCARKIQQTLSLRHSRRNAITKKTLKCCARHSDFLQKIFLHSLLKPFFEQFLCLCKLTIHASISLAMYFYSVSYSTDFQCFVPTKNVQDSNLSISIGIKHFYDIKSD